MTRPETHCVVLTDCSPVTYLGDGLQHIDRRVTITHADGYDTLEEAWIAALDFENGEYPAHANPRIIVVEGNTARVIPNSEIADEALHRERMSCERETAWAQGY